MEYISHNLESSPGLNQKEALLKLQKHPSFVEGSMIMGLRRRANNTWIADVLSPKVAEFPPKENDGGDENGATDSPAPPKNESDGGDSDSSGDSASSDGPPSDGGSDGPPSLEDGDKKPEGKGGVEEQILHTLQQLLHAVQGGGAPEGMGGPDALGPGDSGIGGPPPPKGGPDGGLPGGPPPGAGGPPPPGKGAPKAPPRPLRPGDTPPGGTPVGAPAFASTTKRSTPFVEPSAGTPVPQGQAGPVGAQPGASCPQCGSPEPCPIHGSAAGLNQMVASYSGRAATLTLTHEGSSIKEAVETAKPVIENYGYQVKQAKRNETGDKVHILVSRRQ